MNCFPFSDRPRCRTIVIRICVSLCLLLYLRTSAQTSPAAIPDLKLSNAGQVYAMARQDDGKILVGGYLYSVGGEPRNFIARLNPNGTLDSTWNAQSDGPVLAMAVSGNDIYVAGEFFTIGGQSRYRLAKLSALD